MMGPAASHHLVVLPPSTSDHRLGAAKQPRGEIPNRISPPPNGSPQQEGPNEFEHASFLYAIVHCLDVSSFHVGG